MGLRPPVGASLRAGGVSIPPPTPRKGAFCLIPNSSGRRQKVWLPFAAAAIFLCLSRSIFAQNWNSSVEGTVLDPAGAAIPQARVTLRSAATGLARATFSAETGYYSFPFLPVGTYELEVSHAGFASRIVSGLLLQVGQPARVDVALELARAQSVIRVDAQPPLVETASPALGDEIDNARVSLLPLNGRQFSQLALLAAGAVPPYPNGSSQQFNTAALGLLFLVKFVRW